MWESLWGRLELSCLIGVLVTWAQMSISMCVSLYALLPRGEHFRNRGKGAFESRRYGAGVTGCLGMEADLIVTRCRRTAPFLQC